MFTFQFLIFNGFGKMWTGAMVSWKIDCDL